MSASGQSDWAQNTQFDKNTLLASDVYLRDPSGRLLNHFSVYASYALGGFVGGEQSVRWGWLYNKFADLVGTNLTS